MYLCNAFSLNMLDTNNAQTVTVEPIEIGYLRNLVPALDSAIGHVDTANVLTSVLHHPVAVARVNVSLKSGDSAIVAQFTGPRLPEGATTLPPGAEIRFLRVTVA